jgi:hypothetical protein
MTRAHFVTYALDDEGRPISGVTVTVYDPDTTTPISETLYDADTGPTTLSNPFTGDDDGRVELYLDVPKVVDLKFSKIGFDTTTFRATVSQLTASTLTLMDNAVDMAQRSGIDFQDGFVLSDDAANDKTAVDLDWGDGEITDIGTANAPGSDVTPARGGHVHKHPVIASGDLHPEYQTPAEHTAIGSAAPHHAENHASRHEAGGADVLTLELLAARLVGADYFVYKSGSTYHGVDVTDSSEVSANSDAAVVINACNALLTVGGRIMLQGSKTFNTVTGIVLDDEVTLDGGRLVGEGALAPLITPTSSLGATTPAVELNGTNAAIKGCTVDAGANASEAVLSNVTATSVRDCYLLGGTRHTLANTTAMPRQRWSHLRCDGNSHPATSVIEIWSTDHIVHDVVATGTGTVYGMIVNGNTGQFTGMHLTSNASGNSPLAVLGDNNNFGQVACDTVGTPSLGGLLVKGNRNVFSGIHIMNVGTGLSKPAIALQLSAAGAKCQGNKFFGVTTIAGAQNQSWNGIVKFYTQGGSIISSTAFSSFAGTEIHFAGGDLAAVSGTDLSNPMPKPSDPIYLVGNASSPVSIDLNSKTRPAILIRVPTADISTSSATTHAIANAELTSTVITDSAMDDIAVFEAPWAGRWKMTGRVGWEADADGRRRVQYNVNGGTDINLVNIPSAGSTDATVAPLGETILDLAFQDFINIKTLQNAGNNLNVTAADTVFQFEYIGPS